MEILIGAIVLAVGLVAAAALFTRRAPGFAAGAVAAPPAARPKREATATPVATTTDVAKSAERGADLAGPGSWPRPVGERKQWTS